MVRFGLHCHYPYKLLSTASFSVCLRRVIICCCKKWQTNSCAKQQTGQKNHVNELYNINEKKVAIVKIIIMVQHSFGPLCAGFSTCLLLFEFFLLLLVALLNLVDLSLFCRVRFYSADLPRT